MSYCVHCGVELDPTASFCPLCHTPVAGEADVGRQLGLHLRPVDVQAQVVVHLG